MGRSRYKVYEPTTPHFMTCTILHWIPVFTRPETVGIVFESLTYLREGLPLSKLKEGVSTQLRTGAVPVHRIMKVCPDY